MAILCRQIQLAAILSAYNYTITTGTCMTSRNLEFCFWWFLTVDLPHFLGLFWFVSSCLGQRVAPRCGESVSHQRSISAAVNVAIPSTPPLQPTASALQQKLCFLNSSEELDSDSAEMMDVVCEGQGLRSLELEGLQSALEQAASCNISQGASRCNR